jgi:hypothetical protein
MNTRVIWLHAPLHSQRGETNDKSVCIFEYGRAARTRRSDDWRPRASGRDRAGRPASGGRSARQHRQSSVRVPRQTLLLVPDRVAWSGLVPVRLSLAPRPRLGRSCRMARLACTGSAGRSSATPAAKSSRNSSARHSSADRSCSRASARTTQCRSQSAGRRQCRSQSAGRRRSWRQWARRQWARRWRSWRQWARRQPVIPRLTPVLQPVAVGLTVCLAQARVRCFARAAPV